MRADFDAQPTLSDGRFVARPLQPTDFDKLHEAASDPLLWEQHPASDRYRRDVFETYFRFLLSTSEALALVDYEAGSLIGCSRYDETPDIRDSICIGFTFLSRDHWGGSTNRAVKSLMLDHAFATTDAVWFHIGPKNIRSQKATLKLGAELRYAAELDLGTGNSSYLCYELTRDAWTHVTTQYVTTR